jgi:hypothetical protein
MKPIERPQLQVLSDAHPRQRLWRAETQRAFTRWVLAHGRWPQTHTEYAQCMLFVAKTLYDLSLREQKGPT